MAVAYDDFNGANADPIGGSWTTITGLGALRRYNNTCAASAAGMCGAYRNDITPGAAQYAQCKIAGSAGVDDDRYPAVRISTSATTFYTLGSDDPADLYFAKFVNGSEVKLGNSLIALSSLSIGDVIRLEVSEDNTLTAYRNGTKIGSSYTDSSSPITSGRVGEFLWIDLSDINTATIDDWEGGDIEVSSSSSSFSRSCLVFREVRNPAGAFCKQSRSGATWSKASACGGWAIEDKDCVTIRRES